MYKISTGSSCEITDCLSVLHLYMCAGFSSDLVDVPLWNHLVRTGFWCLFDLE